MGGLFFCKLNDPLTKICFNNPVSFFLEKAIKLDLLTNHGFGFNNKFGFLLAQNFFNRGKCIIWSGSFVNMGSSFCSLYGEFFYKLGELFNTLLSYSFSLLFVILPGDFIFCGIEFIEVMQRSSLKGILQVFVLKSFFYLSLLFSPGKHSLLFIHFLEVRFPVDQKFSGFASFRGTNYSFLLHLVNYSGSPCVA